MNSKNKRFTVVLGFAAIMMIFYMSCKKEEPKVIPVVGTVSINSVAANSAICVGFISDDGGAAVTECGLCWSTDSMPDLDDNYSTVDIVSDIFTDSITNLTENTTYYVRAYATNSQGTAYGNQIKFTSAEAQVFPEVISVSISGLASNGAQVNGSINNSGNYTVIGYGVCWSKNQNPDLQSAHKTLNDLQNGNFSVDITDLSPTTRYYVRTFLMFSEGTVYGEQKSFTTMEKLSDYDENAYHIVTIGEQVWMQENLRVSHYPNGDAIPLAYFDGDWLALADNNNSDAYCYDFYNTYRYGYYYSYAAAIGDNWLRDNNPGQGVCPDGWHLPSNAEIEELYTELDGVDIAGGKMKDMGYENWGIPNSGATNESRFTGVASGMRSLSSDFLFQEETAIYWSADEVGVGSSAYYSLSKDNTYLNSFYIEKSNGLSVRCVKD
jgi:uncharacterized protein (TIGR02145 family)